MIVRYPLLIAPLLVAGCQPQTSDGGRALEGSPADSLVTGTGNHLRTDTAGVEFEAPRLIPGMLATLRIIDERQGRLDAGTLTGYRQAAGALADGMLADLHRVGVGDDGSFRALGDSVVVIIGGGAGGSPEAEPEEVLRSAALARRLIDGYQRRMRAAQD